MRSADDEPISERAFEELIERYADRVYSIALRITGSPEDAEDATQDAFLAAYQHRTAFRGASAVSTWLYRIAVNAALQRVRTRRPVASLPPGDEEGIAVVDWSEDVPRRVELGELHKVIERGIAALPESERAALVLRDVEGLSTAEAAAVLELTEAALKSRVHRARVLLRRYLADYLADA
ncbi:MAG TPA: sigma-70 family RNA polymerase sigma factor [Chloroflexota bacterium]|jgi:RNA polymerase sigma-70 factor (ECF subfamily)|nr:sigma-70 family RNA polymerase sigma factor [Chloroflexota bacterium]